MNIGLNNANDTNISIIRSKLVKGSVSVSYVCVIHLLSMVLKLCGPILRRTHCWKLSV